VQILSFGIIGLISTIAYVLLYLLLAGVMPALAANAIALLVTAIGNTAANRRMTFGISGRAGAAGHQLKGLIAFGAGLVLTSGALYALHHSATRPSRLADVAVLVGANLLATVVRFVLYRRWVFGRGTSGGGDRPAEPGTSTTVSYERKTREASR
jgi:putative flippase GtrA